MSTVNHHHEKGQMIVLFAVAIVGLLAFAALAVDVGMVYSDRRYDQSVADSAALAGAQIAALTLENENITASGGGTGEVPFSCTAIDTYINNGTDICSLNENNVGDATTKAGIKACKQAIQRAASNRFANMDSDISDGLGVEVTCSVEDKGPYQDKYLDIKVMVTSQTNTSFAHLFFGGKMINTVTAITRIKPRMRAEYGYAIVALNPICDQPNKGTFTFDGGGNGSVSIHGGGLYANGCFAFNGSSVKVNVTGGGISYAGPTPKISGSPEINPAPVDTDMVLPYTPISEPVCAGPDRTVPNSSNYTLQPGNYNTGISVKNKEVATLLPGLYCLNGDFDIRGLVKVEDDVLGTASGVTIFMKSGYVNVTANGDTQIQSPRTSDADILNGALEGTLFYVKDTNPCNTSKNQPCVQVQGGADTVMRGTIFSPKGDVELSGNSELKSGETATFGTQIIGSNVKVNGAVTIDIRYEDNDSAPIPAGLNLHK